MGNIVGNQFGLVASKNQETAITDSKAAGNEAKFYITKNNSDNTGETCNAAGNAKDSIALTINGNVLRGMSKKQEETVNKYIGVNPATVYKFKGTVANYTALTKITSVKAGDVYNVTDPTSAGYPKETNFAAIKDGTGATTGIWDSLGGIGITIATADQLTLGTVSNNSEITTFTLSANSDSSNRNKAADCFQVGATLPILIGSAQNTAGTFIPIIDIDLGTGLRKDFSSRITLSDEAISGNFLKATLYTDDINHKSYMGAPFSINETALDTEIKNISDTVISSRASDEYGIYNVLDMGSNAHCHLAIHLAQNAWDGSDTILEDVAPNILKISTNDKVGGAGNGLYISSVALETFVNDLINIAISSYLNAK